MRRARVPVRTGSGQCAGFDSRAQERPFSLEGMYLKCKEVAMSARTCTREDLEQFPDLEWEQLAPSIQPETRGAIEHVLEKQDSTAITREQWLQLACTEGDDLLGLLVAANVLRSELTGNIVTYVVNRNINFTNVCFVGCKFCAFSRGPRERDTYLLRP